MIFYDIHEGEEVCFKDLESKKNKNRWSNWIRLHPLCLSADANQIMRQYSIQLFPTNIIIIAQLI